MNTKFNDKTGRWELWIDGKVAESISDIAIEQARASEIMLRELKLRSLLTCIVSVDKGETK